MKECLDKEPEIITECIKHQIEAGHVGVKVSKCRILILEAGGFIGAGLDFLKSPFPVSAC